MFILGLILTPVGLLTALLGGINIYGKLNTPGGLIAYEATLTVIGVILMIVGISLLFFGFKPSRQGRGKAYTDSELALASYEVLILGVVQLIKTAFFYSYIRIGAHTVTLLLASIFLLTLYLWVSASNNERPPLCCATVLYCILSIAMFIDVIYYKQFTRIPSFMAFKQRIFVDDVGDSVISLITFSNLLYVIDLVAVLPVYFLFFRKKLINKINPQALLSYEKIKKIAKNAVKIILPSTTVSIACIVAFTSFTFMNLNNELVAFHATDAVRTVFGIKTTQDKYLGTLKTDYTDSDLHGVAEGRNLIIIQVESLQGFVINRSYNGVEITPNINALINDSIYFENHYFQTGGGNTSDAEFTMNNSLLAPQFENGYMKYESNTFYGLPWILKENGFARAAAFHGYSAYFWNREKAYPNQGFDEYYSGEKYTMKTKIGMGIADEEFLDQTVDYLKDLPQPYYAFVITLTSHFPFTYQFENVFIPKDESDYNSTFVDYLACVHYTDMCIGKFISSLKEEHLYEDSVIALYGDHFALSINDEDIKESMKEVLGKADDPDYDYERDYDEFFKVPCLIHVPGVESAKGRVISHASGHADIMPTVLDIFGYRSNYMIMVGQNMLSAENGIVFPQASVERSSFFSDDVIYIVPQNNIASNITAIDRKTGNRLNPELFKDTARYGLDLYSDCAYLLDNDLISDFLSVGREETLSKAIKINRNDNRLSLIGFTIESKTKRRSENA